MFTAPSCLSAAHPPRCRQRSFLACPQPFAVDPTVGTSWPESGPPQMALVAAPCPHPQPLPPPLSPCDVASATCHLCAGQALQKPPENRSEITSVTDQRQGGPGADSCLWAPLGSLGWPPTPAPLLSSLVICAGFCQWGEHPSSSKYRVFCFLDFFFNMGHLKNLY